MAAVHQCQSTADFERQIKSNALVVVDFSATWCGPCKRIAPLYDKLAELYAGKITFLQIDTDDLSEVTEQYSVTALPTFCFFRNGTVLNDLEVTGASVASMNQLKSSISQLLAAEAEAEAETED